MTNACRMHLRQRAQEHDDGARTEKDAMADFVVHPAITANDPGAIEPYVDSVQQERPREAATLTEELRSRVAREWGGIAQESVRIEQIGGAIYAFGSELACLRIEHKMRTGRAAHSPNLNTWTYTTER